MGETAIYHITHVRNLPAIVRSGRLLCDKSCAELDDAPVSIAYSDLKERRARTRVKVAAGGTLADYVPFYYAPRSPMLYVNYRGELVDTPGGQDEIVHLVACAEDLAEDGKFAITDGHAATPLSSQSDTLDALEAIDWAVMQGCYWFDTDEDGDRKRRRQAEFLVQESVSLEAVRIVGALDEGVAERVRDAFHGLVPPPTVCIRPDWYY